MPSDTATGAWWRWAGPVFRNDPPEPVFRNDPDSRAVRGYSGGMGLFKWLYRLPGRITGSLGSTMAATGVEGTMHQGVNPVGVSIVAEETKGAHSTKAHNWADDQAPNS